MHTVGSDGLVTEDPVFVQAFPAALAVFIEAVPFIFLGFRNMDMKTESVGNGSSTLIQSIFIHRQAGMDPERTADPSNCCPDIEILRH
jgi:hypothetical protein